ncbi:transposase [Kutzneria sp. 744]|nr:transposase [Kutzneria sp. 744]
MADRWHLWHGLAGYVEKTVVRHRHDLRDLDDDTAEADKIVDVEQIAATAEIDRVESWAIVVRIREQHAAVHQHLAAGASISATARTLRLDRKTVRRLARAASADDLLAKQRDGRPGPLERFKPYLPTVEPGVHHGNGVVGGDSRAGLHRQLPGSDPLSAPVPDGRRRATGHTGVAEGSRRHQVDPAEPRHHRRTRQRAPQGDPVSQPRPGHADRTCRRVRADDDRTTR